MRSLVSPRAGLDWRFRYSPSTHSGARGVVVEMISVYSNADLCRKGLRRHWSTVHKNLPFPEDRYRVVKSGVLKAPLSRYQTL
jgi:hypothetical protein